ncbi:MAG: glycosyltransferase, partial [Rickettsiales bacterium]|nr:glycosyltransferase [Rickettsiales bacterium]
MVGIIDVIKTHGVRKTVSRALGIVKNSGIKTLLNTYQSYNSNEEAYKEWIAHYDTLEDSDREAIKSHIEDMACKPKFSVLMPVYNIDAFSLRKALDSVIAQLYSEWELCIADDASTRPHIKLILDEYSQLDKRINVCYRSENGHIVEASNSALSLATGEFVVLLDHDDMLSEHALYFAALEINKNPDLDLIYSDEDKIKDNDERYSPYFKSDWNPDLLYGQNMFSHLGIYRTSLIRDIGGFRQGYEGSQDYDLCLRASKHTSADKICHIPRILYHWRAIRGSTALNASCKKYALNASRNAITDFFAGIDEAIKIVDAEGIAKKYGYHRVVWPVPSPVPLVSILIHATENADAIQRSIESIQEKTTYDHYEFVIPYNKNTPESAKEYLYSLASNLPITLLECYDTDNKSDMLNKAAFACKGSILVFIDNTLHIDTKGWLNELVSNAIRPDVGAVGAKLLHSDNIVASSGLMLGGGENGIVAPLFEGIAKDEPSYLANAILARNVSAIPLACLAIE